MTHVIALAPVLSTIKPARTPPTIPPKSKGTERNAESVDEPFAVERKQRKKILVANNQSLNKTN